MLVAVDLALTARCKRCSAQTPVGGVRDEVPCLACGGSIDVRDSMRTALPNGAPDMFEGDRDVLLGALTSELGEEVYSHRPTGDWGRNDAMISARAAAIACRSCRGALALPPKGGGHITCGCGVQIPLRWPDAQTTGWDLRLTCVVGEADPAAPKLSLSGIVVPCGGCGAPLSGPIHERSITCDHCNTANLLPEAIFMRLVPDAPPQPFMLVYDVTDRLLAQVLERTDPDAARWRHNARYKELQKQARGAQLERALHGDGAVDLETARELAARDLTADEAKHIDNWLSNREREKLVGGRIAQTLIDRWTASTDTGTRAVAARVANPARFVADPDADVRAAVAARKHLAADMVAKLAKDGASQVRAAIAARKDCPVDLLKKLGHDGDPHVAKAARANPAYPPGLFKRLFGG